MSKTITTEQINTLNSMTDELVKNDLTDLDETNKILKDMLAVLGEKPMFESLEDFDKFMSSDKPLVF